MNKICTSLKQSQKLIELGIDINTADMCYSSIHNIGQEVSYCNVPLCIRPMGDDIPAWSLSALMYILPEYVEVPPYLNQNKYMFNKNNGTIEFGDNYHTEKSTNPFDAIFEMIVWRKENGKI